MLILKNPVNPVYPLRDWRDLARISNTPEQIVSAFVIPGDCEKRQQATYEGFEALIDCRLLTTLSRSFHPNRGRRMFKSVTDLDCCPVMNFGVCCWPKKRRFSVILKSASFIFRDSDTF